VPEDRAPQPVRSCGTLTPDLSRLAAWLHACRIETVAMESTGVYGLAGYEIREARGFQGHLVHARPRTHVPGRQTDVQACQCIPSVPP
jgi:transposase